MTDETETPEGRGPRTRAPWSTRKKDQAPKGLHRLPDGRWGIQYLCALGCRHQEAVGPKSEAERAYRARRTRAHQERGWCPKQERQRERARARVHAAREARRVTFRAYSADYLPWAQAHKRGWKSDRTIISAVLPVLGERRLDEITTADVERFRDSLVPRRSRATANRYRDGLSGMFRRAIRLGLLDVNPVKGVPKFREGKGRVLYFTAEEEAAIRDALPTELRRHFAVSIHTGLRYSEQMGLRWRDVDLLADIITVPRSKNGDARQVPINSVVRSVLFDLGSRRQRPEDPEEHVFALRPGDSSKFFPAALERAQAALRDAGKDASRLDGAVWHTCRHTFASRLVMAGVDLRTVQELGGWRTFGMVQRYSHLAPAHLRAAVERLVPAGQASAGSVEAPTALRENYELAQEPRSPTVPVEP